MNTVSYVQLGWIQSAINYLFDKLLNPFISFVTTLLSDGFKWLFNEALGPLLQKVFEYVIKNIMRIVMRILGRLFYRIEVLFLQIVDVMQDIFNVLAGTKPVTDTATGKTGSLLTIIMQSGYVRKTMLIVIAISIVLCFAFAIVGVVKSIGDMEGPDSKPVGQVLRKLAMALLRMVTAPIMGIFLIMLGDALLLGMTNAMTMGSGVTIARSLFVISTLDAVDDELGAVDKDGEKHGREFVKAYNYSTRPEYLAAHSRGETTTSLIDPTKYIVGEEARLFEADDYGLKDIFREPFYNGTKDYTRAEDVDPVFNMGRINYMIGIGGAILFVFILGTALFVFTSRLFDVVVLLLIEPFFIATMPLDGGEHFKKWEDMFIGKLFSGYGMVVAMYLYLLVASMVFDGRLSFTPGEGAGDIVTDMLMKILILVGGAATIMTAGPLVTSILNSMAGESEAGSVAAGMAFTGTAMDWGTKPARFGMKKGVGIMFDKITGYSSKDTDVPSDEGEASDAFTGSKT